MKKTSNLLLPMLVGALVGCATVPTSELQFGAAKAKFPKDASADELELRLQQGTNILIFRAVNFTARNNPAVIGASTEQIKAHYAGAASVIKEGVNAAIKAGAASQGVPVPPQ